MSYVKFNETFQNTCSRINKSILKRIHKITGTSSLSCTRTQPVLLAVSLFGLSSSRKRRMLGVSTEFTPFSEPMPVFPHLRNRIVIPFHSSNKGVSRGEIGRVLLYHIEWTGFLSPIAVRSAISSPFTLAVQCVTFINCKLSFRCCYNYIITGRISKSTTI